MNLRAVVVGAVMIGLAIAFFFYMASAMAQKSNDPETMMRTVGMVSGGFGGLGVAMIIFGMLRRQR